MPICLLQHHLLKSLERATITLKEDCQNSEESANKDSLRDQKKFNAEKQYHLMENVWKQISTTPFENNLSGLSTFESSMMNILDAAIVSITEMARDYKPEDSPIESAESQASHGVPISTQLMHNYKSILTNLFNQVRSEFSASNFNDHAFLQANLYTKPEDSAQYFERKLINIALEYRLNKVFLDILPKKTEPNENTSWAAFIFTPFQEDSALSKIHTAKWDVINKCIDSLKGSSNLSLSVYNEHITAQLDLLYTRLYAIQTRQGKSSYGQARGIFYSLAQTAKDWIAPNGTIDGEIYKLKTEHVSYCEHKVAIGPSSMSTI